MVALSLLNKFRRLPTSVHLQSLSKKQQPADCPRQDTSKPRLYRQIKLGGSDLAGVLRVRTSGSSRCPMSLHVVLGPEPIRQHPLQGPGRGQQLAVVVSGACVHVPWGVCVCMAACSVAGACELVHSGVEGIQA